MSERGGRWWRWAGRAVLSAGLIGIVARHIDLAQAKAMLLRPQALTCGAGAIVLFNVSKVAAALRLNACQRQAGVHLGEGDNLRLYYAGMFLNLFLPGGIGGDAYKIVTLARRFNSRVTTLLAVTLIDRASGMLTLLILLSAMVPWLAWPWSPGIVQVLACGMMLASLAAAVLMHSRLQRMANRTITAVLALGLLVQLLQLGCMAEILSWLQVPAVDWPTFLALFLASSVIAALPLSWGGLGAREVTFLFGMQLLHADPTPGVLAASAFFLVSMLSALPGALFMTRPVIASSGRRP